MFKKLSDNLNILMGGSRLTSSELARRTGVHATTIKRVRNNEQANPTVATLLPLAQYFSISLSQLVGDEPLNTANVKGEFQKIPVLTWQECVDYDSFKENTHSKRIYTERQVSNKAFALMMEEEELTIFPQKSMLIIEPERMPESGDYVLVAKMEQKAAFIKRYIVDIDQVYLKSLVAGLNISPLSSEYKMLGVIIQSKLEFKIGN